MPKAWFVPIFLPFLLSLEVDLAIDGIEQGALGTALVIGRLLPPVLFSQVARKCGQSWRRYGLAVGSRVACHERLEKSLDGGRVGESVRLT